MAPRSFRSKIKRALRVKNELIREFLAEFFGTFTLIVFGIGANAQSTLSHKSAGEFLTINLAWGWSVAMGVWVSGGVTGGHLNPAVTLTTVVLGRTRWIKLPIYWCAQYLGTFVASACVFGVYYEALEEFDGGVRSVIGENATAGIWATYPLSFISIWTGFGDQIFGTAMLVVCVMAFTDRFNIPPSSGMVPLALGGVITVIGMSYGYNAGYAINPARDFGARAFTACAGWGVDVFTVYDYYFWVPLVAPHIGAIAGAWLYQIFVGIHTEKEEHKDIEIDSIDHKNLSKSDVTDVSVIHMPDYDKL